MMTALGTVALNASGVATFTTTAFQLPVGVNQAITASFGGNSSYAGSTSTSRGGRKPASRAST